MVGEGGYFPLRFSKCALEDSGNWIQPCQGGIHANWDALHVAEKSTQHRWRGEKLWKIDLCETFEKSHPWIIFIGGKNTVRSRIVALFEVHCLVENRASPHFSIRNMSNDCLKKTMRSPAFDEPVRQNVSHSTDFKLIPPQSTDWYSIKWAALGRRSVPSNANYMFHHKSTPPSAAASQSAWVCSWLIYIHATDGWAAIDRRHVLNLPRWKDCFRSSEQPGS